MAFNELDRRRVEKRIVAFVEMRRPPVELREQLDLGYRIDGQTVELFEARRSIRGHVDEMPVARLRYVKARSTWTLYWMSGDLKWHRYPPLAEAERLDELLEEIDEDPNACFFG